MLVLLENSMHAMRALHDDEDIEHLVLLNNLDDEALCRFIEDASRLMEEELSYE